MSEANRSATFMIVTVIIFIVTILVLVLVHELGHFLVAKKFNVLVEEFGFGIPPKAWGKKFGETIISINWLPFGGFVRLLGEDEVNETVTKNPRSFTEQPVGKRIGIVLAGVVMNLLLAWLLFYIVLGFQGFKSEFPLVLPHQFVGVDQKNESLVMIQSVASTSPAGEVGLKTGERVVAINDQFVTGSHDVINKINQQEGKEFKLTLSDPKMQKFRVVNITPRVNPPSGQGPLGVSLGEFELAKLQYNGVSRVFAGPIHSVNIAVYSGKILGHLIGASFKEKSLGPVSQSVAGPVGITSVANSILTSSDRPLLPYLDFVAVLSLNLAVMNVLPFPALDGGRLFFLLIEAITRKKVHAKFEKLVHTIGMAILLTLIVLVTFSDIKKFF